jgi:hypothetical protein
MAKKTVVKRVTRIKRVAVPVIVERKTTKRVRMPSLGRDVIDDVKVEKKSVLVGVPRAVVAPGRSLKKKPAA